jgi:hypothetical protein
MRLGRRIVSVDLVLVNHALVVASRYRRPVGTSAGSVNAMHRILIALVTDFASGFSAFVDLEVGTDGGLYVLSRGVGAVPLIRFGNI